MGQASCTGRFYAEDFCTGDFRGEGSAGNFPTTVAWEPIRGLRGREIMAQSSPTETKNSIETKGSTENRSTTLAKGPSTALNPDEAYGRTTIASSVVQKVAGIAAREVSGLHALGGGVSRAFGALKERIPGSGTAATTGVSVEVGEKQAAVDLEVVVEYGARIVDVARAVRRNVITTVEQITGLEVIEVNISVNDIHFPEDDAEQSANSRVE
jgi:uncharacterized alkaline shock family protein YloU